MLEIGQHGAFHFAQQRDAIHLRPLGQQRLGDPAVGNGVHHARLFADPLAVRRILCGGQGLLPQVDKLVVVLAVGLRRRYSPFDHEERRPGLRVVHDLRHLLIQQDGHQFGRRATTQLDNARCERLRQCLHPQMDGEGGQRLLVSHVFIKGADAHAGHGGHLADGHALVPAFQQNPNKGLLQCFGAGLGSRLTRFSPSGRQCTLRGIPQRL